MKNELLLIFAIVGFHTTQATNSATETKPDSSRKGKRKFYFHHIKI